MIKIELSEFDAEMILAILLEFNSEILGSDYLVVSNAIGLICDKISEGVNHVERKNCN